MIYNDGNVTDVPQLDLLTLLFESNHCAATESSPLHADAESPDNVITKFEARTRTKQIAHFLRNAYGIGQNPGQDVVVTVSTGQCALPLAFYGVVAAQGVYSAASATATPEELARQIRDGPAKVLICSPDLRSLAVAAASVAGLPLTHVLELQSKPAISLASLEGGQRCTFTDELAWPTITDAATLATTKICILYSSGTTGLPKGVTISHANMVAEAHLPASINRPIWQRWAASNAPFESRTLGHLPAAHIAAVQGYFVNPFYDGGVVYWMPRFDFGAFLTHAAALRITTFFSVPPIYGAIAQHPLVRDQLAHVRIAYSGAAPLGRGLQAAATARLGGGKALVSQTWGATETCGAVTHLPPDRTDDTGSVGVLLPNVQMRLVDDEGQDVKPGEEGEALLRGPLITPGYHNNPEANAATFTADGWMRTGDILRMNGDLLYVVDRKKEMIKYKGLQVAPAELEALLRTHPGVADAAVIGVPGPGTEVPRAYVVAPDQKAVTAADLQEFVRARVAGHKQLRGGVVFVAAVPRNQAGKILRRELRDLAAARGPSL